MSSTNFTIPRGVRKIDCFCVGGGGDTGGEQFGGGSAIDAKTGGGGGGYTRTVLGVDVTPGGVIAVTVGFGSNSRGGGGIGGTSSIGSICSANGGFGGTGKYIGYPLNDYIGTGGNGGSGGGGTIFSTFKVSGNVTRGFGGVNGGDGETLTDTSSFFDNFTCAGGKGQHTTTRYFGESNGTLYASGSGGNNTASFEHFCFSTGNGTAFGDSGIAIIRWGDQKS